MDFVKDVALLVVPLMLASVVLCLALWFGERMLIEMGKEAMRKELVKRAVEDHTFKRHRRNNGEQR